MPMMSELLQRVKEDPPETEAELTALLDETGYDLIMKQPSGTGDAGDASGKSHGAPEPIHVVRILAAKNALKGGACG